MRRKRSVVDRRGQKRTGEVRRGQKETGVFRRRQDRSEARRMEPVWDEQELKWTKKDVLMRKAIQRSLSCNILQVYHSTKQAAVL